MMEILIVVGSALWLGILTSISPCPLAANIAAVSFISKRIEHPRLVFLSGVAYIAGRITAYTVLGILIIFFIANIPGSANFLQKYMNILLGPVLIIAGLVILDILKLNFSISFLAHEKQKQLAGSGIRGAFFLGIIFALSFCPISAALFFGSLIPLAVNNKGGIILPLVYGIGTGLPVVLFAVSLALGIHSISHWFNKFAKVEFYMRKLTGTIFIVVGLQTLYISLINIMR
ncbi:MAG: aromatic aminobenezylarsenical efflux permease ArsG family transporter [Candidatus Omnitrophota bacterium]